jgi:hypothetical protein
MDRAAHQHQEEPTANATELSEYEMKPPDFPQSPIADKENDSSGEEDCFRNSSGEGR